MPKRLDGFEVGGVTFVANKLGAFASAGVFGVALAASEAGAVWPRGLVADAATAALSPAGVGAAFAAGSAGVLDPNPENKPPPLELSVLWPKRLL